MENWEIALEW